MIYVTTFDNINILRKITFNYLAALKKSFHIDCHMCDSSSPSCDGIPHLYVLHVPS